MKKWITLLLVLAALLLSACGEESAQTAASLPEESAEPSPSSTPVPTPEPTPEPTPGPLAFPDGSEHDRDEKSLDLSWLEHEDAAEAAELLRQMPELRNVDLGADRAISAGVTEDTPANSMRRYGEEIDEDAKELTEPEPTEPERLSWKDIRLLQEAAPQAEFSYRFRLFGKSFSLQDEEMDLNHRYMDDEGAAVREVLSCMKHCRYLDMDFCGVSDEAMAAIREDFPEVEVVWRIWFGRYDRLSVRTDVEKILASDGGFHIEMNSSGLQYCTKVRYLDMGHMPELTDWSFLGHMPELEVCVISVGGFDGDDLAGLANCPHLEYLEMCSRSTRGELDLSFLAGLTELKHLNIACLRTVTGYEALENLKGLERLWIGDSTSIPEDYRAHLVEVLPDTRIDLTTQTGVGGAWRWVDESKGRTQPRYLELCRLFDYEHYQTACAYYWNDPLYKPHD